MELKAFELQMDRLRITYGEKVYPKDGERDKAIWERVKAFPAKQFENAVTHLIGETFTPPTLTKISESLGFFRTNAFTRIDEAPPAFSCEPCRDFGFVFDGDFVEACMCATGRSIGPEKLAHHQKSYDRGRKIFKRGKNTHVANVFQELPYDPGDRSGEWR